MEQSRITFNDKAVIPIGMIPGFRTNIAIQNKVERNLLFRTWGGLGDQICAEPTLRYALKAFKDCDISLSSECPELFSHLKFKEVFNEKKVKPNLDNYLVFETITPPNNTNLVWQFFSHMLTNCVDFPSLCALRMQLPIQEKEIFIKGICPQEKVFPVTKLCDNAIFVHAGKHWPSKTFPKDWWNETLREIIQLGLKPILLGADTDDNRGTVDVDNSSCLDLRNKLTVGETTWLLQRAKVLLTNDSSPMHMAASTDPASPASTGFCYTKFIATCKHPDYITHWRKKIWQFREENLGLGGMWDIVNNCPNQGDEITVDKIDESILRSWLPAPKSVALNVKDAHDNFWVV